MQIVQAPFANPNVFGAWLILLVSFKITLYQVKSNRLDLVLILLSLFSILLTFSRGTWGGMLIAWGFIYLVFNLYFKSNYNLKRFVQKELYYLKVTLKIIIFSLLSLLAILLIVNIGVDEFFSIFRLDIIKNSFLKRWNEYYVYGLRLIGQNLLLGVGPGNGIKTVSNFFNINVTSMHNTYLMVFLEVGFIGFIVYIYIFYSLLRKLFYQLYRHLKKKSYSQKYIIVKLAAFANILAILFIMLWYDFILTYLYFPIMISFLSIFINYNQTECFEYFQLKKDIGR